MNNMFSCLIPVRVQIYVDLASHCARRSRNSRVSVAVLVAVFLGFGSFASAHDEPRAPYPEKEAHRPTPIPDRIVLTFAADPSTTQSVTWRTDTSITEAVAEIGVTSEGPQKAERTVSATTTMLESDLGPAHYHTVHFDGLRPQTTYSYRVGDNVDWSEWFQFRTASAEARPFRFVYFGDAQNSVKMHWSRVFREAFREAPRAAFTLHAGDLINRANRDAEWGEWFHAPAWVHATVPVVATPGNHEYARIGAGPREERHWHHQNGHELFVRIVQEIPVKGSGGIDVGLKRIEAEAEGTKVVYTVDAAGRLIAADDAFAEVTGYPVTEARGKVVRELFGDHQAEPGIRVLSNHWRPQFAFPMNGPEGLEETCFYLDYQDVRIVSLNSNEQEERQVDWLLRVLSDNPQRWTILTFHHPIFSAAGDRDNPELRALWRPLIEGFRVDLVLQGHDHTYARSGFTNLPTGLNKQDVASGTVYVVSVSGPKMYSLTREPWMARAAEDTQLFQVITVDGDELHYEARTTTGRLYDAFTLAKRTGLPNELREALPAERLRPPPAPASK